MGLAGETAFSRLSALDGNASYRNYIIDAVYNMTPEQLEEKEKYEEQKKIHAAVWYNRQDMDWQKTLCQQVEDALKGGITCLQLREKELPDDEFLNDALAIKDLCRRYNVPFFINDNVDVAIKCNADGVHVGQEDMNARDVRSLIGEKMMIGVSAHTVEEALEAERNGADYLGVGTMFTTSTKPDAEAVSLDTLK